MSKIVKLYSAPLEDGGAVDEKTGHLDKKVMLVYCGKFESMDGPVEIKDEDIEKLVSNHNQKMSKLSRLATGEIAMKNYPPIQLDHSTSAKDTVGRLIGDLAVGQFQPEGGVALKAMYGTARFLGKENIEKVQDGRWSHVSMGADLENHELSELTVTPFPAAPNASLMSQKRLKELKINYRGKVITVKLDPSSDEEFLGYVDGKMICSYGDTASCIEVCKEKIDKLIGEGNNMSEARLGNPETPISYKGHNYCAKEGAAGNWIAIVDGYELPSTYKDYKAAVKEAKSYIDENAEHDETNFKAKLKKLSKPEDKMTYKEMSEKMAGYTKAKKHLMDEKKMSEEDADKHLESASDDDVKKMAAEHDDKEKKMAADKEHEKEAELKRLSAYKEHKSKLVAFAKGVNEQANKVQLAKKKLSISNRLSKFKAEGKVTPAEIKSLDIDKLSSGSDEVINATLSSFDKREPVIDTGLVGTTKALSAGQLAGRLKKMNMERDELQTRLNMGMKRDEALKRMAELDRLEKDARDVSANMESAAGGEHDATGGHEQLWGQMKSLMDAGKHDEAKEHLRKHLASIVGPRMTETGMPVGPDTEPQMSALADGMKKMQTEFADIVKLVSPIFDIKPEELV